MGGYKVVKLLAGTIKKVGQSNKEASKLTGGFDAILTDFKTIWQSLVQLIPTYQSCKAPIPPTQYKFLSMSH